MCLQFFTQLIAHPLSVRGECGTGDITQDDGPKQPKDDLKILIVAAKVRHDHIDNLLEQERGDQ